MTTVIVPVYSLRSRGLERVQWMLYSLNNQSVPCKVIVVDGSSPNDFVALNKLISKFSHFKHVHRPLKEFNKPVLLNHGIKLATSEYVMCTDADYLFRSDFMKICQKYRRPDRLLHKEVKMLPSIGINLTRINQWNFPDSPVNNFGTLANGACQYATKEFFINEPYDERMSGWGCMDNLTAWKAKANKMEVVWIAESEILHQYHKNFKLRTFDSLKKFERNKKIVHAYRKEHHV